MATKGFRLVPAELPKKTGRSASHFYTDIVEEFTKSGLTSAAVEGTGKTPLTVWHGLKTALKNAGVTTVKVSKRKVGAGDVVYLYKPDEK